MKDSLEEVNKHSFNTFKIRMGESKFSLFILHLDCKDPEKALRNESISCVSTKVSRMNSSKTTSPESFFCINNLSLPTKSREIRWRSIQLLFYKLYCSLLLSLCLWNTRLLISIDSCFPIVIQWERRGYVFITACFCWWRYNNKNKSTATVFFERTTEGLFRNLARFLYPRK